MYSDSSDPLSSCKNKLGGSCESQYSTMNILIVNTAMSIEHVAKLIVHLCEVI